MKNKEVSKIFVAVFASGNSLEAAFEAKTKKELVKQIKNAQTKQSYRILRLYKYDIAECGRADYFSGKGWQIVDIEGNSIYGNEIN